MRKAIVLTAIFVLLFLALSVAWLAFANSAPITLPIELQKNLQGEFGYSVYQLADGSLVLNTSNQTCTFLVKINSSNQVLWSKPILIDPANTTLPRLRPTADGGFILAGIVDNLYTVVKTDSDGNVTWTKTFSSGAPINYFQSIIQTNDRGFAFAWLWSIGR